MILALLGIEVPLNMGVEVTSDRAVTRYLIWGPIVVIVAYLLTTFGVMIAVPASGQANVWSTIKRSKFVMPRLRKAAWNSGLALTACSHSKNSSSMMDGWAPGM